MTDGSFNPHFNRRGTSTVALVGYVGRRRRSGPKQTDFHLFRHTLCKVFQCNAGIRVLQQIAFPNFLNYAAELENQSIIITLISVRVYLGWEVYDSERN